MFAKRKLILIWLDYFRSGFQILMKIQFVLSEKSNINSFIYCLNLLYGNFTETLFTFTKNGLSISQFWEDKNTDRGKYYIFFDTSFFSKITCPPNETVAFKMNLKEILQKLKSHKKDVSTPIYFLPFSSVVIYIE